MNDNSYTGSGFTGSGGQLGAGGIYYNDQSYNIANNNWGGVVNIATPGLSELVFYTTAMQQFNRNPITGGVSFYLPTL